MTVRTWLMVADCWRCGISIELSEEQIRQVERMLEIQQVATPPIPPPVKAPVARHSAPAKPTTTPQPSTHPPRPTTAPQIEKPTARTRTAPPREPSLDRPGAKPPANAASAASTTSATPPVAPAKPSRPPSVATPPVTSASPSSVATAAAPAARQPMATVPRPRRSLSAQPARHEEEESLEIFKALFHDMPAWLLSFIFHLILLIVLGLIQPALKDEGPWITLTVSVSSIQSEGVEPIHLPQTPDAKFDLPLPKPDDLNDPRKREALLAANQEARELRLADELDSLPEFSRVKERVQSANGVKQGVAARDPRLRVDMVKMEGGTTLTEAAVARALRWFQKHQAEDGRWGLHDFHKVENCSCSQRGGIHDNTAGTALALLPYLGAGQHHLAGKYREEVAKGLRWLIQHQKDDGDLRSHHGNSGMYAQGQATIVLCEAFAMTGDEELRVPAQKAVDFIVKAQYNDGGWRYDTTSKSQPSDTSVVGWQLMALQSARAANLTVPEQTFKRVNSFLNRVQHDHGAFYGYQPGQSPTPAMTAEGLLCRLYLGWTKTEPGLHVGVKHLLANHPPKQRNLGIYYWYYATQTFHHYGGAEWTQWNQQMRDILVESQDNTSHSAGSWAPIGEHSDAGGRIYMTSLAACTLEVYYRHLPIFRQIKVE